MSISLVILLIFYFSTTVFCLRVKNNALNGLDFTPFLQYIIIFIPLVNIIICIMLLDLNLEISNESYSFTKELYRNDIEKYKKLIYKYKRNIRVGSIFICPDTNNYDGRCRGKKALVTKINDRGLEHIIIGTNIKMICTWDCVDDMIFLSNEPAKPFSDI